MFAFYNWRYFFTITKPFMIKNVVENCLYKSKYFLNNYNNLKGSYKGIEWKVVSLVERGLVCQHPPGRVFRRRCPGRPWGSPAVRGPGVVGRGRAWGRRARAAGARGRETVAASSWRPRSLPPPPRPRCDSVWGRRPRPPWRPALWDRGPPPARSRTLSVTATCAPAPAL